MIYKVLFYFLFNNYQRRYKRFNFNLSFNTPVNPKHEQLQIIHNNEHEEKSKYLKEEILYIWNILNTYPFVLLFSEIYAMQFQLHAKVFQNLGERYFLLEEKETLSKDSCIYFIGNVTGNETFISVCATIMYNYNCIYKHVGIVRVRHG